MFVSPQDVSICMSMCVNTTAYFGPSFTHFFSLALRFCRVPCRHLFVASAGITRLPLRVPEHCGHSPSSLAVHGELLPQQLAHTQRGGGLQSTWMHMQLFPARQSCSFPSLEIKVLRRCQHVSPLGVCPFCLQENSYVLESFTAIIPKFRQQ